MDNPGAALDKKRFYKDVVRLALPISLQSLIASSLSLVDNLMVGSLGEAELAAVGAGIQIYIIHWLVLFGFTGGSATFIAQFWGARNIHSIKKTIGFAFAVSIGIGLIFFSAAVLIPEQIMSIYSTDAHVIEMGARYIKTASPTVLLLSITQPLYIGLRATQQTRIPLFTSVGGFITNTVLNYFLIFGSFGAPRLETTGAAIATVIARALEMTLVLIVVFPMKNIIGGKVSGFFGISKHLAGRIVKVSIPTTANESLWGLGNSMYMAAIGHIGVTAYAAAQASNTIQNVFIMFGFSVGDAALIMIGERLGRNETDISRSIAKRMIIIAFVLGIVNGALLIIFSPFLIGFFGFTPEGASYAHKILIIYGCQMALNLMNGCLITGVLRGGGDTAFAAISELSCVWLIGVPLAFIGAMALHLPVYMVILMLQAEQLIKFFILLRRFFSGKWANNVIQDL